MNIHSSYFKRFFYHNFIFWGAAFILSLVVFIIGNYKLSISPFLFYLTIGTLSFIILFLAIDLFLVYKFIKPKSIKLIEGKLFLNDKELKIENINSITPICYSKTNWFINVIEIQLKDQIINVIDHSQYGNGNSKSIRILINNFPLLNSKLSDNLTKRKFS